jgi:hypothetical protein
MTLTFTYVSMIDAALREDKMTPSADKRNFMQYIPMMAAELRRLIFSFIDLDTRITMLLDARPYLKRNSTRPADDVQDTLDNDPFRSLFTHTQITKIYRKGFLRKLFFYQHGRLQNVNTEITQMAPQQGVISYPIMSNGLHADPELLYFNHPIVNILRNFSERFPIRNLKITQNPTYTWVPNSWVPIAALSLLSDTVTFNTNIDHYLRKKAFDFIIAIDCFTRPKMEKKKKDAEELLRKVSLLKLSQEARIELKRRKKVTLRTKEATQRTKILNRMLLKRTKEAAQRTKEAAQRTKAAAKETAQRTKAAAKETAQRTKILNRMLLKRDRADTLR